MKNTLRTYLLSNASLALLALLALLTLLAACAGVAPPTATPTALPAPSPTPDGGASLAPVDSLEVLILESFPVQVHVIVKGNMPDACTHAGEITQARIENTFKVTLPAQRPADAICAQVLTPYEQVVILDVRDLPKGTYTVDVNGTTATFELQIDNTLPMP